jgi:hypothetical protein
MLIQASVLSHIAHQGDTVVFCGKERIERVVTPDSLYCPDCVRVLLKKQSELVTKVELARVAIKAVMAMEDTDPVTFKVHVTIGPDKHADILTSLNTRTDAEKAVEAGNAKLLPADQPSPAV